MNKLIKILMVMQFLSKQRQMKMNVKAKIQKAQIKFCNIFSKAQVMVVSLTISNQKARIKFIQKTQVSLKISRVSFNLNNDHR